MKKGKGGDQASLRLQWKDAIHTDDNIIIYHKYHSSNRIHMVLKLI